MNKIIRTLRCAFRPEKPVADEALIVEPNSRGGWQLRFAGAKTGFGNYATDCDALRIAKLNFGNIRILTSAPAAEQAELACSL